MKPIGYATHNLRVRAVGHADVHLVRHDRVALDGPHLVLCVRYVHNLHLAHGLLLRSEAQRLRRHGEHALALGCVDCDVGGETRLQLQVGVRRRDNYLVRHEVVRRGSLLAHLLHLALESVVGVSVYGERHALALLHVAYVSLVNICHYLHVGEVLRDGEQLRRREACRNGLSLLNRLR